MTLRLVQIGNALPYSFICDPAAEFQPGYLGQLTALGNQVVCGVSDGTAVLGVLDDLRTKAFSSSSIDEIVIAPATGIMQNNKLVTPMDVKIELNNPNILPESFMSDPVDVELIPRNGVVKFIAGTELNFDLVGEGTPNAIRTVVSYTYQISNLPGDDSTLGSGRVTLWGTRGLYSTDQYSTNVRWPLNSIIFSGTNGLMTTSQPSPNHSGIALVTGPPSASNPFMEYLYF